MLSPTQGFLNQTSPLHTLSGTQIQAPQGPRKYLIDFCHTQGSAYFYLQKKKSTIYTCTHTCAGPQSCSGDKELALPMAGSP